MTADRDDLAAMLRGHLYDSSEITQEATYAVCSCTEWTECATDEYSHQAHATHVAQMVLESDWLRDVKAEACAQELRDWADELDKPPYDLWDRAAIPRLRDRADRVDAEDGGR